MQNGQPLLQLVSKKNLDLHEYLNMIVMEGMPFSFIESVHFRKICKLDPVSVESLMQYMSEQTRHVSLIQFILFLG